MARFFPAVVVSGARQSGKTFLVQKTFPPDLVNSLVLQEAKSSSEIENIITTNDELYKALVMSGRQATPAAKEVIDYRAAVWRGYELLRKRGG